MSSAAVTVAVARGVASSTAAGTTSPRGRQQKAIRGDAPAAGVARVAPRRRGTSSSSSRATANAADVRCRAAPNGGGSPGPDAGPGSAIGLGGALAGIYDAVGEWLVEHPAPQWLVNSPLKTRVTEILAGSSYDPEESVAAVQRLIASDDVVVFSATYCPFSAAAKAALRAEGVPFTAVEWNRTPGGGGFAPALATLTGRSSIPHVFIGGESVGGFNDGTPGVRPLIASGHLDEVLEICSEKTLRARAAHLEAARRR